MDASRLATIQVGSIVSYRLRPSELPKNPLRLWHGRVEKVVSNIRLCWIWPLEEGYEGTEECILFDQIVDICEQPIRSTPL